MSRYIKDGKVAVLYSPEFGSGWSTWGKVEDMVFNPELVEAVLSGDKSNVYETAKRLYPDVYDGGLRDLTIGWLDIGTNFVIDEYDGYESIRVLGDFEFLTA